MIRKLIYLNQELTESSNILAEIYAKEESKIFKELGQGHLKEMASAVASIELHGNALFIGIGSLPIYPVAVALNMNIEKVDIVQPRKYMEYDQAVEQTEILIERIAVLRKRIELKYGQDLIGSKVNTESYQGFLNEVQIPKDTFSSVFLIRVLNDPESNKIQIIADLLPVLKNEAKIVIGDFDFEYSEKDFLDDMNMYFWKYCTITKIDEINAGSNTLCIFKIKKI
jgi:hypothetical protein